MDMVPVLAAPLSIQRPANPTGKAVEDGSSTQDPASHVGDWNGIPGSWLPLGTAQATEAIWEVKELIEDLSLPL